ncbi:SMP-30/gluconolactonase/LRE family protein [Herbiconiux sp.]|uniref:SMP-30/gluconolactonase/LRE family protein n=1 Tax=Herbiconiux sp. TaxID=1871186 RepID=UPI0025C10689|nr:SMP-30/gluconolactonase/LRE family protein [Herbiconiux sp.]
MTGTEPGDHAAAHPAADAPLALWRDAGAILVESLWWDAARRAMRWTDISTGELHTSPIDGAPDGSDDEVLRLPPPLASFQPNRTGGLVVALGDRVVVVDERGTITRTVAEIDHRHGELRLNEGKCDPFGAFVVGSMNLRDETPDGALYRVHADGRLETLLGGLSVANGFEWSDDGATFYFTDTTVKTVYRAPYSADGPLGEPVALLTGLPSDGLARDRDGGFWSGLYGEGAVVRRTAAGAVTDRIDLPAPNITSVAFGGDDLATLFVGSAREQLAEGELATHPSSGGIFALDTGRHGHPVNSFG